MTHQTNRAPAATETLTLKKNSTPNIRPIRKYVNDKRRVVNQLAIQSIVNGAGIGLLIGAGSYILSEIIAAFGGPV